MGLRTPSCFWSRGRAGGRIGRKDQCTGYSAPSSIHCLRTPISFWLSDLPVFIGGMSSSSSFVTRRAINSLWFGLARHYRPVTAQVPDGSLPTSRRSFAFRCALSGPWQSKQFSAKMARALAASPSCARTGIAKSARTGKSVRKKSFIFIILVPEIML